jgi:hypothetical protein
MQAVPFAVVSAEFQVAPTLNLVNQIHGSDGNVPGVSTLVAAKTAEPIPSFDMERA